MVVRLNMKKIKKTFCAIMLGGFLTVFLISCGSVKSTSNKPTEKVTFPIDKFTISSSSDTTIFGQQGTRLFIEKETFQFPDGTPVTGSIKIELKEFYKKSDIVLADLSTESNGKLLETGGMINIQATSEGREIEIKANKKIIAHFPKSKSSNQQMNLFYADKNSTDTSITNWELDTAKLLKTTLKLGSYGWQYPDIDDSTDYDFMPKDFIDTGYYWNPIDLYVSAYNFSEGTKKEIEKNLNQTNNKGLESFNGYGIECEMTISKDGKIRNTRVNSNVSKTAKTEILDFLKEVPILEPGKNKYGEIIERKGYLFITGGNIIPLYKTNEEYVKSFDRKYSQYEKKPIKSIDDAELEYYILSIGKLGWINCDIFIDSKENTDFIVQLKPNDNTKIKMIFQGINGILAGKVVDNNYIFPKVPMAMSATIVAIKNSDGQLKVAFESIRISDKPLENLGFKETSLTELRKKLDQL
jgi:hypothetical protein